MSTTSWPADHVERRPIDSLIPYARNSRSHGEEQIAQIAASIQEWGWTIPILCDEEGAIIAGHARVMAAKKLGLAEVPVMTARGWSDAQRRAYVIADNKLTLNSSWDMEALGAEFQELQGEGFDLGLTGFGEDELADILAERTEGNTDPDAVPDAPETAVSVTGDVWILGKHRLVCGDCTEADTVAKALNGVEPHLMVTDPPYGVNYDPEWRNRVKRQDGSRVGAKATGVVHHDDRDDWRDAWSLFPGDVAYVWHGALHATVVAESLVESGFPIRSQIIWAKQQIVIGRGDYHWQHEPCWYAVRKGRKGHWSGDRKQSTIWRIDAPSGWRQMQEGEDKHTNHSTQKPVECMKRPIENNSSPGQAVYEPFSGSGTTIIAAEMTGRACHAIELHPPYVDVAVKRWQDFTGEEARHEGSGQTFAEVAAGRGETDQQAAE